MLRNNKLLFVFIALIAVIGLSAAWWFFNSPAQSTEPVLEGTKASETGTTEKNALPISPPVVSTSNLKKVTTSNGYAFFIPASWNVKQAEKVGDRIGGGIAGSNVLAISNAQFKEVAHVACPSTIGKERYEVVDYVSTSRTFTDSVGTAYEIRYVEAQDYAHSLQGKKIEEVYMVIKPDTVTIDNTTYGEFVSGACMVLASGQTYWENRNGGYSPIATADLITLREIYATWTHATQK